MTRETAAGLIVSCSFLCLVGVVLFTKMNEPEPAGTKQESQDVTLTEAPPAPEPVAGAEQPQPLVPTTTAAATPDPRQVASAPPVEPAPFRWGEPMSPRPLTPAPGSPPVPDLASPSDKTLPASSTLPPPAMPAPSDSGPSTPALDDAVSPPLAGPREVSGFVGPLPERREPTPDDGRPTSPPRAADSVSPAVSSPTVGNSNERLAPSPSPAPSSLDMPALPPVSGLSISGAPASAGTRSAPTVPIPEPRAPELVPSRNPSGNNEPPVSLPAPPPAVGPAPTAPPSGSPVVSDGISVSPGSRPGSEPGRPESFVLPPLRRGNNDSGAGTGTENQPPRPQATQGTGSDSADSKIQLKIPAASLPSSNPGAQGQVPGPSSPFTVSLPTDSARAPGTSPSLSSSGPNFPQVESYDEETYTCRTNDSFRSISQEFYRTDKYERALALFNRNHPLATDAVRRDPPLLQPGQPIYVPPARILERYYASAFVEGAPASPRTPADTEKLPALRPGSGSLISPVPAAPTTKEKTYRVPGNGAMILDIARRTLGTGDRWPEIYRLNPKIDPRVLIPGGTELRLPSDARVETTNPP
jgi:hypothetical protein